jgi:hypothetical protein
VVKNLVTHRVRNRKTAIMFAVSLGFILFITMAFQLELYTAKARMYKSYGSDMIVYPHWSGRSGALLPNHVAELESILLAHPTIVAEWGWVTSRLKWNDEWDDTFLSNLGHAFSNDVEVWGVSSNLLDVTFNEYLVADSDTPSQSATPLSEQLYTPAGSQAAILGTSAKKQFGLANTDGTETSFLYALQKRQADDGEKHGTRPPHSSTSSGTFSHALSTLLVASIPVLPAPASLQFHRLRPLMFLDNCPRFALGRFPSQRAQPTIVSLPTFMRLSNNAYKRIQDIPMSSCILKFAPHVSNQAKDELALQLTDFVKSHQFQLWDIRRASDQLAQSNAVMSMVFSIATYIAMFLCLFSLVASMLTNLYEQSKEISVLRSIGLTKTSIIKIFTSVERTHGTHDVSGSGCTLANSLFCLPFLLVSPQV